MSSNNARIAMLVWFIVIFPLAVIVLWLFLGGGLDMLNMLE